MKNKTYEFPLAMVTKKFFCHRCGEQLKRKAKKRLVKRGDPDYRRHCYRGGTRVIGDVEVTEYDFQCPGCGNVISFDEQNILSYIQKKLERNQLSETDILAHRLEAERKDTKRSRLIGTAFVVGTILLAALFLYLEIKLN